MRSSITQFLNNRNEEFRHQDVQEAREMTTPKVSQHQDTFEAVDVDSSHESKDFSALVWSLTSQTTPAPESHENMVMAIVSFWTALISVITLANFTHETKALIIGYCVNVNLFFFYGAPLLSIVKVLKERNSASIHLETMITNTLNSSFWTAYGFAILDGFIFIPNGIGAILGIVQIVLVAILPRKMLDQKKVTEDTSPSDSLKSTATVKEVVASVSNV
jgi:hypothetical protein